LQNCTIFKPNGKDIYTLGETISYLYDPQTKQKFDYDITTPNSAGTALYWEARARKSFEGSSQPWRGFAYVFFLRFNLLRKLLN